MTAAQPASKTLLRVVVLLLIIGLSLAILAIPQDLIGTLQAYGYPGIFLLSLASNATIIIPAPAILVVFAMGAHLDPIGLGLVAGSGAALGELSGYLAGLSGQAMVENNKTVQRLSTWVKRNGSLTIFLLAALPNPFFDFGGLAAGALRMPVQKFLLSCWCGKVLRMYIVALAGAGLFNLAG